MENTEAPLSDDQDLFFVMQYLAGGRFFGGGRTDSSGDFPFSTTKAIFKPHMVWSSR